MKTFKNSNAYVLSAVIFLTIIISPGLTFQADKTSGKSDTWPGKEDKESSQVKKYKFVGAEKCASVCHNNDTMGFQYNKWKNSLHAEAFNILGTKKADRYAKKAHIGENPQLSPVCVKCHVSGGDLDSSYFTLTYRKEEGITCEACHKQLSDGKTYLPRESDCLKCHNNSFHKMNSFSFTEACAKIAHPIIFVEVSQRSM